MKKVSTAMIAAALFSNLSFAEDCTPPELPSLPEGATSSMEQMLAGQQAVKTFQAANLEYMSCMDPKISAAVATATAEDATDADKAAAKALEEAYNNAVSKEEELAGKFNAAIRAYKEANPS